MHSLKKGEKREFSGWEVGWASRGRITFVSTDLDPLPNSAPFGKGSQRPEQGGKGHYCSGFTDIFDLHSEYSCESSSCCLNGFY